MFAVFGMHHNRNARAACRWPDVKERADLVRVQNVGSEFRKRVLDVPSSLEPKAGTLESADNAGAEGFRFGRQYTGSLHAQDRNVLAKILSRADEVEDNTLQSPNVQRQDGMGDFQGTGHGCLGGSIQGIRLHRRGSPVVQKIMAGNTAV
jgi:hypothetical protein